MFGMKDDAKSQDAVALLEADHEEVDTMFKQYDSMKDEAGAQEKKALVSQICNALSVHAQIEEELFYPAARRARGVEDALVDEAAVEHQSLKDIIARLRLAPVSDPLYDAGVKVLSEYTKHHVKEEETELFPEVRKSELDLIDLAQKLQARKDELIAAGAEKAGKEKSEPVSAMKVPADMPKSKSASTSKATRSKSKADVEA